MSHAMAEQIESYADQVTDTLAEVSRALEAGHYGTAVTLMNNLSSVQASTSLKLRNVLIRDGLYGGGDSDQP